MNMLSNKKKKNITIQIILTPLIIAGIILVVWKIFGIAINHILFKKPFMSPESALNYTLPKGLLIRKIDDLQDLLNKQEAELLTAKLLRKENEKLKLELGRGTKHSGVLANVVTLPNRSIYDSFTIDVGSDHDIQVGQIVYGFDNIALGSISFVEKYFSKVSLFSASGRTTSGTAGEENVIVALIGRGGGEYEVRMPRDLKFDVGGIIAYQSIYPSILAEVKRIETDPRDPFQRLIAKTPVNLQALKWVIVRW